MASCYSNRATLSGKIEVRVGPGLVAVLSGNPNPNPKMVGITLNL